MISTSLKRKVLILNSGALPFPGSNGCSVQLFSIVKSFVEYGMQIRLIGINPYLSDIDAEKSLDLLTELGVKTELIESKKTERYPLLQSMVNPPTEKFYNGILYRSEINKIIEDWKPDYIYCYTLNAALSYDYDKFKFPNAISIVDIDSLVYHYRNIYTRIGRPIRTKIRKRLETFTYRNLNKILFNRLKKANIIFEHAFHHKNWLDKNGIPNVYYFPVNVLESSLNLYSFKDKYENPENLIVSLIGNVHGIATLSGLYAFFRELLPELSKKSWSVNIQFDIVGGGKLSPTLERLLQKTKIRIEMKGYVKSLDQIYEKSHIILVPTPIELGFRTRIVEAFSRKSCVMTHISNAKAMPEVIHGNNAIVYRTAKEFGNELEKLFFDTRRMEIIAENAYATYLHQLKGEMIGKKMVEILTSGSEKFKSNIQLEQKPI